MPGEPTVPRAVAFVDGQNLYHSARAAFGCAYPDFDAGALSRAVCRNEGWSLRRVRFYTGVPDPRHDPFWSAFWQAKLAQMGRHGIETCSLPLRYRMHATTMADGRVQTTRIAEEKGIDVRIAIDVVRMAHRRLYDVALLFSQDQDLSEVAKEIREIAHEQARWIKIASAFPRGPRTPAARGID